MSTQEKDPKNISQDSNFLKIPKAGGKDQENPDSIPKSVTSSLSPQIHESQSVRHISETQNSMTKNSQHTSSFINDFDYNQLCDPVLQNSINENFGLPGSNLDPIPFKPENSDFIPYFEHPGSFDQDMQQSQYNNNLRFIDSNLNPLATNFENSLIGPPQIPPKAPIFYDNQTNNQNIYNIPQPFTLNELEPNKPDNQPLHNEVSQLEGPGNNLPFMNMNPYGFQYCEDGLSFFGRFLFFFYSFSLFLKVTNFIFRLSS